jgi:hypothetical protein
MRGKITAQGWTAQFQTSDDGREVTLWLLDSYGHDIASGTFEQEYAEAQQVEAQEWADPRRRLDAVG